MIYKIEKPLLEYKIQNFHPIISLRHYILGDININNHRQCYYRMK
jgi:hypothetical protein